MFPELLINNNHLYTTTLRKARRPAPKLPLVAVLTPLQLETRFGRRNTWNQCGKVFWGSEGVKSKLKNPFVSHRTPPPPRRRRMESLHPDTRIAALARGGLLCVGPEGVRAFGVDGRPLLDGGRPRGKDLVSISASVSASRHCCPWGASAPAALTAVLDTPVGGGEARNDRKKGEMMGETYSKTTVWKCKSRLDSAFNPQQSI